MGQKSLRGEWKSYTEFVNWYQRTEPYIYRILDRYSWKGKGLEVGCGQGALVHYLKQKSATLMGLDQSFASLVKARFGNPENPWVCGDAQELPFQDNTFDYALCIGVLHHTPYEEIGVMEILRVLKPGGFAVVMLYRKGNPKWWATRLMRWLFAGKIQLKGQSNSTKGTALQELFGCPILKAFSGDEVRFLFRRFRRIEISHYQVGFKRLVDILDFLKILKSSLSWVDKKMVNQWGFYQVIYAQK